MQLTQREFQRETQHPHLLITGGVHGDEFEPMLAIRRLIALFETGSSEIQGFRGRITFVPVVNEAAFLRGHRVAEDALDLARVCPGRENGSITEQTAYALSQLIRSVDYYVDLHTGGTELSVLPMVGYNLHLDEAILKVQREMARAFNLPNIWGTAPNLDGRSLSVARDAGVPALYAEYHGSASCDRTGVEAYVDGCLNLMGYLEMLDRPIPQSRIEHIVEDFRPSSGHMQVCNPSPIAGYFEAAVELGDRIRIGDLIGTVCDNVGVTTHRIEAQQNGLLLVLRTFPRVHKGETVGVVLDLEAEHSV